MPESYSLSGTAETSGRSSERGQNRAGRNSSDRKNFVYVELPEELPDDRADNRILQVCVGMREKEKDPVILVTKDLLLRLKAQLLGIQAEDFEAEQVEEQKLQYTGRDEVFVPEEYFKDFKKKGVPVAVVYKADEQGEKVYPKLTENQFLILRSDQSEKKASWEE